MAIPVKFRARVVRRRAATLSRLIVECVAEFGEVALDSFFPAKYPEARIWRTLLGLDKGYRFSRDSFATTLSRLRAQGLLARRGRRGNGLWCITKQGKEYLRGFARDHGPRPDGVRRLVIFDIPERERKKRDALRAELIAAQYQQLQKSVWMGAHPLPSDFVELVHALQLSRYVHIFSIRDAGTLV